MKEFDKLSPWQIVEERDEINNRFLRVRNVTFCQAPLFRDRLSEMSLA
jgi:hypothetical protein